MPEINPAIISSIKTPKELFNLSKKLIGNGFKISKILKSTKAAMKAEKDSLQKSKAMNWPINSSKTINPGSLSFIVFNVR